MEQNSCDDLFSGRNGRYAAFSACDGPTCVLFTHGRLVLLIPGGFCFFHRTTEGKQFLLIEGCLRSARTRGGERQAAARGQERTDV
jgi:hypothetical protein